MCDKGLRLLLTLARSDTRGKVAPPPPQHPPQRPPQHAALPCHSERSSGAARTRRLSPARPAPSQPGELRPVPGLGLGLGFGLGLGLGLGYLGEARRVGPRTWVRVRLGLGYGLGLGYLGEATETRHG